MWPSAAMTRLRRSRKPLQILRIKSFLIEAHEQLAEDFNSSTLLWRTLHSQYASRRYSRGGSGQATVAAKSPVGQKFMFDPSLSWTICAVCAGAPFCWNTKLAFLVIFLTQSRIFVTIASLWAAAVSLQPRGNFTGDIFSLLDATTPKNHHRGRMFGCRYVP